VLGALRSLTRSCTLLMLRVVAWVRGGVHLLRCRTLRENAVAAKKDRSVKLALGRNTHTCMIESHFWRQELRADLTWLRRHQRFRRWSEKQQVLFERRLMIVAFQIRVLLERPKVSAKARNSQLKGRIYPKIGEDPVTLVNAVSLELHFDLDHPRPITLPIRELCNQLIHHYVMFALRGAGHFKVVAVFSDFKRNECLYEFDVGELLDLLQVFASDESASRGHTMQ
jgi:hypothetical protein